MSTCLLFTNVGSYVQLLACGRLKKWRRKNCDCVSKSSSFSHRVERVKQASWGVKAATVEKEQAASGWLTGKQAGTSDKANLIHLSFHSWCNFIDSLIVCCPTPIFQLPLYLTLHMSLYIDSQKHFLFTQLYYEQASHHCHHLQQCKKICLI